MWHEVTAFGLLLALGPSCQSATAKPPVELVAGRVAERPSPRWPTPSEPPPPRGFGWQTVHHETIHARLLVPAGWRVDKNRDGHGYPYVRIRADAPDAGAFGPYDAIDVTFSAGTGYGELQLLEKRPRYYGEPIRRTAHTTDTLVVDYANSAYGRRILGFARGLQCKADRFRDEAFADKAFQICGSIRAAAPGVWRQGEPNALDPTTVVAIPDAGFVRRAGLGAQVFLGSFVLRVQPAPAGGEQALLSLLDQRDPYEQRVELERRQLAGGKAFVRRAQTKCPENKCPGDVIVALTRSSWECRAIFPAFPRQPATAEIDYAVALCDTLPRPGQPPTDPDPH